MAALTSTSGTAIAGIAIAGIVAAVGIGSSNGGSSHIGNGIHAAEELSTYITAHAAGIDMSTMIIHVMAANGYLSKIDGSIVNLFTSKGDTHTMTEQLILPVEEDLTQDIALPPPPQSAIANNREKAMTDYTELVRAAPMIAGIEQSKALAKIDRIPTADLMSAHIGANKALQKRAATG